LRSRGAPCDRCGTGDAGENYSQLIEAAQLLRHRDVSVTIVGGIDLSGEGPKLKALMEQGAVSNVTLAGAVDRGRVLQLLSSASLFVNCSLQEGMSNAVLEAIQQGSPIILSDIEANRDLICRTRCPIPRPPISRRGSSRRSQLLRLRGCASASRIGMR
jgi:hypothetical protein